MSSYVNLSDNVCNINCPYEYFDQSYLSLSTHYINEKTKENLIIGYLD